MICGLDLDAQRNAHLFVVCPSFRVSCLFACLHRLVLPVLSVRTFLLLRRQPSLPADHPLSPACHGGEQMQPPFFFLHAVALLHGGGRMHPPLMHSAHSFPANVSIPVSSQCEALSDFYLLVTIGIPKGTGGAKGLKLIHY